MRIANPQREAETIWVLGSPLNRVDIEAAVFQPSNMQYLTGEYEAFVESQGSPENVVMQVSVECMDPGTADRRHIEGHFVERFLKNRPTLSDHYADQTFALGFHFVRPGELEFYKTRGRPKRLVDRRVK